MKYKGRELVKGEKVRMFCNKEDENFVIGKYIDDDYGRHIPAPVFMTEGGKSVYGGYECRWIPEKEALEAEKIILSEPECTFKEERFDGLGDSYGKLCMLTNSQSRDIVFTSQCVGEENCILYQTYKMLKLKTK